ncbi:MAG TPA: NAD(P)/FAD-dependent oxidoreductase [Jiangellales bacterium]|nr:NAD(P)/FAD-dependent oxidoreductase [Jiangellales bacterium]
MSDYDVAVIGGGAAGLSAALVLSRARRRVAVVDAGRPRNAPAAHMHGFLSRDGFPPQDLLALGRAEVRGYGGDIIDGTVAHVEHRTGSDFRGSDLRGSDFRVGLADGSVLRARRLLVATGLQDVLPDVPGVRERFGRDVLHCPYCHGYEVRDQPIGVLGGTPEAVQHAQLVRQWSADVIFFPHTDVLTPDHREQLAARGIGVVDGPVRRVVVDEDRLSGVELGHGVVVTRAAVFVRPGSVPHSDVLVALGAAVDDRGWVVTDATGRTTVPGVWAAGNVADPRGQVITAAGQGSAAAIAVNADLVESDVAEPVKDVLSRPV